MILYFNSMEEIIEVSEKNGKSIAEMVLIQTAADMETSVAAVQEQMAYQYMVMKASVIEGMKPDKKSLSGLTGNMAHLMHERHQKGSFSGSFMSHMIASSLAVIELNACMGKIVAAPTGGSCGIIPGTFIALQTDQGLSDEEIINGLLVASAIGTVIAKNASISGAECGCQAECGSAAAMAAGGMVAILGGTNQMISDAVAHTLKGLLGLVCDPVAGLVEEPCVIRNPTSAGVAIVAAEMALAGIKSIIPCDEVILTMKTIGQQMPATLRETAEGGLAVTKTGLEISKILLAVEE